MYRLNLTPNEGMALICAVLALLGEYLFTPVASTVYTLRVRIKDTQLWVYINGVLRITAAVTMDVVGTRVALRTSTDSTSTFDNLVVRGI